MNAYFVFAFMIFCHVIDDYNLQGILASMKQVDWWKKNAPEKMYENDWIMALFMHSFSWSFMVHLPVMFYINFSNDWLLMSIAIHALIHMIVDHLKANEHRINLIQDQTLHMIQLVVIWFTFMNIVTVSI